MQNRGLVLMIFLLLMVIASGCSKPAALPAPEPEPPNSAPVIAAGRFLIAGSGTNLPITEKLAVAYNAKFKAGVEIPKSIGTDGAIKAVQTGALDMGLISRELTAEEKAAGLKEIPYARVGIVFATHPDTPDNDIGIVDILKIHQGGKTTWSDGRKIVVLVRNLYDSSNLLLFKTIPGFEAVLKRSLAEKRWQVMYHDAEMSNGLRTKPGAFGHTDMTEVKISSGIKALTVDGIAATPENIQTGRYPFSKQLSFVYKDPLSDRAKAFASFVDSAEGRSIVSSYGGIPVAK